MAKEQLSAAERKRVLRQLQELIAALERRVPRIENAGEARIARDAAALRKTAEKRIMELQKED